VRPSKKSQIVERAAALFEERGYSNATMEDIAAAVGLAKPTLYHYFKAKDEIFHEIHRTCFDVLMGQARQPERATLTPDQELRAVMTDLFSILESHPGYVRVLYEHQRELPLQVQNEINALREEYFALVEGIVARGIERDVFHAVNVRVVTLGIFGMCNWAYHWYDQKGPLSPGEVATELWEMVVKGLAAPKPARRRPAKG
jgi:TetR/AcrR family transcriptional regulator, cholesterol catabolism regulator